MKKYFVILLLTCSCGFLPKSISRAIYFDIPKRTNDIVVIKSEKFKQLESKQLAIINEEVSGLEYDSRKYFLPEFKISDSKLNTIQPLKDKSVLLGYQDGSIFEILTPEPSFLTSGIKSISVRKFANGNTPVLAMAESSDGKLLAVAQFSVVSIIDIEKRVLVAQMHRVKGRILALAWSPDSRQLLMGRANGDIFSWEIDEDVMYTSDSNDVLDLYETHASPVVGMVFHPSGRAFFAALENGSLFLIRLLQTEIDLGLREDDDGNTIGKGSFVQGFGGTPGGVSNLFISPEKDELLVVSSLGSAIRWRVRGLKQLEVIDIGSEASTFSEFIDRSIANLGSDLVVGVGRSLRLKISCLKRDYKRLLEPTSQIYVPEQDSSKINALSVGNKSHTSEDDEDLLKELNSEINKVGKEKSSVFTGAGKDFNLVTETTKFKESVSDMSYSTDTGVLWVGGKSGMLSGFYLRSYLESSDNLSRIDAVCK